MAAGFCFVLKDMFLLVKDIKNRVENGEKKSQVIKNFF